MRNALMAILMAATAATPAMAQDTERNRDHYERQAQRNQERYERRQERTEQRQEAQPQQRQEARPERAERQGGWQGRQQAEVSRQQQVEVQQQQVQRQQVEAQRSWSGRSGGGNWQGRDRSGERDAQQRQFEATREQSRREMANSPSNYQRQAERNERRWEQQVTQQRYGDRDNRRSSYGDRSGYRNQSGYQGNWNRGWRNDNRYDWQNYRYSNRDRFRGGNYYAPYRNYRYNRLSIGLVLDSLFYSRNYWISDPWQYRLPPAPYGTQWVRYYNDVLLIDVYSGEVVDVIYDFFW